MKIRLRFQTGPRISKTSGKNRHVAAAVAALLWPGVLVAYSLALWALSAQLRFTVGDFGIYSGIFSHWQVWIALGLLLQLCAYALGRYGRTGAVKIPEGLSKIPGFGSRRA